MTDVVVDETVQARSPDGNGPLVSIIVPCFDVGEYVGECVASALAQHYRNLEVIAVDDGSIDRTPEILSAMSTRDARLRVITTSNRGLGAARNVGLDASRGTYHFFLDGDDVLPPDVISTMVASAERTHADFVSGVAYQFDSSDSWRSAGYRSLFDDDRTGCHVSRDLDLVYDQMACSKLFRSSFWREHGLRFPEGVLYEDVVVVMRAHWLASSVDIVSAESYRWRRRDDGSRSITQDRFRPGSAAARFAALGHADDYLRSNATAEVWAAHGTKICLVDLRLFARLVPGAPTEWVDELFVSAGPTLAAIAPEAVTELNVAMRLLRAAMIDGDRRAVEWCLQLLSGRDGRSRLRTLRGAATLCARRPKLVWASTRR